MTDANEALRALEELESLYLHGRSWKQRTDIIRAHLSDPGYVRVPVNVLRDGGHFAGLCAERMSFDGGSILDEADKRTWDRLRAHKQTVRELLAAATEETSHER